MVLGLGGAFGLNEIALRRQVTPEIAPRDLVVGGAGAFATIGEALQQARDGDVVRVEPGRYAEALELRRDVTLLSTQPHGAVLTVPAGEKAWASVTVWSVKSELRGFRIVNTASAGHVGVRVHTGDVDIDAVAFDGPLEIGVDAVGDGSRVTVRGSRFTGITGIPVKAADRTHVALRQNLFRAPAGSRGPAVSAHSAAGVSLDANVFMHFAGAPVAVATGAAVILDPSFVIAPPAPARRRAR
ncbi:MAG: hypothetical protein M3R55_03395 [Acidobacteriota bacterium]|nr:hypothetical protein [Acidobacteriota bacterium]